MSDKYFRIMQTPTKNWEPYRIEPMYDEAPDSGSYKSTLYVSNPAEGDYLVVPADEEFTYHMESSDRDFDAVQFDAMPALSELLKDHLIIEVPEFIAQLDLRIKGDMSDLRHQLDEVVDYIKSIDRGLFNNDLTSGEIESERKVSQEQFAKLSADLDTLQAEYQTKVITALPVDMSSKPLHESEQAEKIQMWYQNATNSASRNVEIGYQQEDLEL